MKLLEKVFSKYLKKIDIFGYKTELKIQGNSQYRTIMGGVLTILMKILGIILLIYFGNNMYYKNNPNVFRSEVFEKDPDAFKFTKDTGFFMFGIEHPLTFDHFYDPSVYSATLNIETMTAEGLNKTKIPLETCSREHLPTNPDLVDYFMTAPKVDIKNLICVKKEYFNELEIKGAYDSAFYQSIRIYINSCQNSTINNFTCQSPENISAQLGGYFAFYTIDFLVNPGDYDTPAQPYGKDYFGFISSSTTLRSNRFIALTDMSTNQGWMMDETSKTTFPTLSEEKETMTIGDSSNLVIYTIRRSHSKLVVERTYKKLQEVLAEIGGVMNIIFILFKIIAYPLVHSRYYRKLINEIFNFEGGKDGKRGKLISSQGEGALNYKKQLHTILSPIHHLTTTTELENFPEIGKKRFSMHIKKKKNSVSLELKKKKKKRKIVEFFLKPQKKKIDVGYWEVFKAFFTKNKDLKTKIKQNNRAMELIKNKLNIINILKKFVEIDKLKALILDKDQMALFEYMPKPFILKNRKIDLTYSRVGEAETSEKSYIEEKNIVTKSLNLLSSFKRITKKDKMNELDKKLISFLDENIKNVLNEQTIENFYVKPENSLQKSNLIAIKEPEDIDCSERKESLDSKIKKYHF